MVKKAEQIKIIHVPSGEVVAQGPLGWGITPFEGNLSIRHRYLRTENFKVNYLPGICIHKFLYAGVDFVWMGGKTKNIGWIYWLPNPLFPFIWFRVAVPRQHSDLRVESIPVKS